MYVLLNISQQTHGTKKMTLCCFRCIIYFSGILFLAHEAVPEEPEGLAARGPVPALFIFLAQTSAPARGGRRGRSAGMGGEGAANGDAIGDQGGGRGGGA